MLSNLSNVQTYLLALILEIGQVVCVLGIFAFLVWVFWCALGKLLFRAFVKEVYIRYKTARMRSYYRAKRGALTELERRQLKHARKALGERFEKECIL